MVQVVLIRPSRSVDRHFTRSTGLRERMFLQVEFEPQDVSNWYSLNSTPIFLICQARPNFSTCSHYISPVTQTCVNVFTAYLIETEACAPLMGWDTRLQLRIHQAFVIMLT